MELETLVTSQDFVHTVIAFIGGGILNTTVLAYIFFRMVSVDRQLAEVKVHLAYMRRELNYANGRELEEPENPK